MVVSIGDALFSKGQQKVLALLFGQPGRSFYLNEVVRLADMGRGVISRELNKLEQASLLVVTKQGNQNHYQANKASPVFNELVAMVKKTFGLREVIAEALNPMVGDIQLAFIYGSMAKGGEHQASDIDLLLVGDTLEYGAVMSLLLPVEAELGRPINPTLYQVDDFKNKLREGQSFLTRITEQPKLMIKGIIDDFR
jgi:predicted nucleotidyltransferase